MKQSLKERVSRMEKKVGKKDGGIIILVEGDPTFEYEGVKYPAEQLEEIAKKFNVRKIIEIEVVPPLDESQESRDA